MKSVVNKEQKKDKVINEGKKSTETEIKMKKDMKEKKLQSVQYTREQMLKNKEKELKIKEKLV